METILPTEIYPPPRVQLKRGSQAIYFILLPENSISQQAYKLSDHITLAAWPKSETEFILWPWEALVKTWAKLKRHNYIGWADCEWDNAMRQHSKSASSFIQIK